jgi:hypothetical protein
VRTCALWPRGAAARAAGGSQSQPQGAPPLVARRWEHGLEEQLPRHTSSTGSRSPCAGELHHPGRELATATGAPHALAAGGAPCIARSGCRGVRAGGMGRRCGYERQPAVGRDKDEKGGPCRLVIRPKRSDVRG